MPGHYPFGWLRHRLDLQDSHFELRTAHRFDEAVACPQREITYTDSWFYPPLVAHDGILLPTGRFELPITHILIAIGKPFDRAYGDFLILALGFLLGLRLTIQGTGHLTATAVRPGELVNFIPSDAELLTALGCASDFWNRAAAEERTLAFAAIHTYLAAQSYRHQYEQFAWQYMVLDNVHLLTWHRSVNYRRGFLSNFGNHGHRPPALSAEYGSPLPTSFRNANGECGRLTHLRNELLHEARWLGQPLGYAADATAHDIISDLKHFNSQLILGFLGIACRFRASVYDRQMHALDLCV